jgi:hypothetical protein
MKKAKIMLSAIAIFAVVGGAFAFKAQRSLIPFFSNTTTTTIGGIETTVCTLPVEIRYTTAQNNLGTVGNLPYSSVSVPTGPCTTTLYRTL